MNINQMNLDQARTELQSILCKRDKPQSSVFPIFAVKPKKDPKRWLTGKGCPYTKEFLEDLYVNQGISRAKLAKQLKTTQSKVNTWLFLFDITLSKAERMKRTGNQDREILNTGAKISVNNKLMNSHNNRSYINGYPTVFNPGHPSADRNSRILEHRHAIEAQIHRFLETKDQVHHINYDRADNRPINLVMVSATDHRKFHNYVETYGAYLMGITQAPPSPIKFNKPAFWNGSWYDTLSVEDLQKAFQGKNSKGNISVN